MARKKEYDKNVILNLATELFWKKGFKATSISDLVKTTGLNKYSMYEEFTNKEGIFKECLLVYTNKIQKENIELLSKEPLGVKNIQNFLLNRIEYTSNNDFKGCMVINSVVEKESLDKEIFSNLEMLLNAYEEQILKCLKEAQKNKEIPLSKNIKILAKYVVNFSSGLMVVGKTAHEKEDLFSMLEILMDTIKK